MSSLDLSASEQSAVEEALSILSKKQFKLGKGSAVDHPHVFHKMAQLALATEPCETYYVVYLDNRHQFIADEKVAHGGISTVNVPIRYIARRCIDMGAKYICVAHNHPSGNPSPSSEDLRVCAFLFVALEILDVQLIESIVVGQKEGLPVRSHLMEAVEPLKLSENGPAMNVIRAIHKVLQGGGQ